MNRNCNDGMMGKEKAGKMGCTQQEIESVEV